MNSPTSREVIVVAGLASRASKIASFDRIAREIAGKNGSLSYVDGAHIKDGRGIASGPTRQATEINKIVEAHPKKEFIILSQSLGAVGLLSALEDNDSADVRGIAVAPPLPYPNDVLYSRVIAQRMTLEGSAVTIPSLSFGMGEPGGKKAVLVPAELFDEVHDLSKDYETRTRRALNKGALHIVAPTNDWNDQLRVVSADMPNILTLPGIHSLMTDEATLESNARAIAKLVALHQR